MAEAGPGMTYDEAFGDLSDVYLEDSWVFDVAADGNVARFRIEAVLTAGHELYTHPRAGEQYCYRLGSMTLQSDKPVVLRLSGVPPAVDASGELDMGNIDTFLPVNWEADDAWELTGSWGELLVVEPNVRLVLD